MKNTLLFLSSKESLQLLTSLRSNLPLPDADKFNWILVTDSDISDKVKLLFMQNVSSSDKCVSKSMLLLVPNTNIPTREFNKYFEHEISTFGSTSVHPLVAKFSKQYLNVDDDNNSANHTDSTAGSGGKRKKKLLITSSEGLSLTIKSVWTLALALKQVEADQCTTYSLSKSACIEKLTSKGLRELIASTIRNMSNESLDGLGIASMENDKLTFNQLNILQSNKFSLKVITSSCKLFDSGYFSDENGLRVNEVLFSTLNVDQTVVKKDIDRSAAVADNLSLRNVNSSKATVLSGSRLFMTPPVTLNDPMSHFQHRNSLSSVNKTLTSFVMGESTSKDNRNNNKVSLNNNNDKSTESQVVKSSLNVNDDDASPANMSDNDDDDGDVDDDLARALPLDVNYSYTNSPNVTREKKRKRNSMSDNNGNSSNLNRNNITRNGKENTAFNDKGNYHHLHHTLSPATNGHRQRDIIDGTDKIVTNASAITTTTASSIPSFTDHSVAMFAKSPSILTNNSTVGRQGRRGVNNLPNVPSSATNKNNVVTRNSMGNNYGNTITLGGQSSASTSLISWLGRGWSLLILITSVIGSLITLYTFTFLLMKSCEGALGHNYRQSLIAINLLSIMLLFLGSMLYIFEPSPALCTARRSAHNLSLCLLFGSLLIKSMYLRAYKTIGLGGQVNQMNQFLTLLFIVAVQISIESHSWKALSDWSATPAANVNLITSNSIHHLCSPFAKDYLSTQAYLLLVFILLLLFTWISRNEPLTTNEGSNLFTSTALISPVFITCIVLCEYFVPLTSSDELPSSIVYLTSSRDAINSISMIIIGYITLCTIFIPILYSIHTYGSLISGSNNNNGPGLGITAAPLGPTYTDSSLSTAFTMFRGGKNIRPSHTHTHLAHHERHNHRHNHSTDQNNGPLGNNVHSTDHRPILDNLSTSSGTSSTNHDYHINHSSPNRLLNVARMHAKQSDKKPSKHSKSFAGQLTHHLFSSSASSMHGTKLDLHSHDDNGIHFSPCSNSYSYACNSPNCNFKLQPRTSGLSSSGGPSPRLLHARNHLGLHLISTSSHASGNGNGVTCNPNGTNSPNGATGAAASSTGNSASSPATGATLTSRFPPGLFRNEIPTFNRFISSTNKTRGVERDRGDHGTLITGVTYNRMNPLFENTSSNGMPNSSQIYRSAYP